MRCRRQISEGAQELAPHVAPPPSAGASTAVTSARASEAVTSTATSGDASRVTSKATSGDASGATSGVTSDAASALGVGLVESPQPATVMNDTVTNKRSERTRGAYASSPASGQAVRSPHVQSDTGRARDGGHSRARGARAAHASPRHRGHRGRSGDARASGSKRGARSSHSGATPSATLPPSPTTAPRGDQESNGVFAPTPVGTRNAFSRRHDRALTAVTAHPAGPAPRTRTSVTRSPAGARGLRRSRSRRR